ncbi:MAG: 16S rRNA (guanine(966)-N(2))-methyltransferase RsmD [Halieaceae bacterium]|jgi:16S rRNA (guanine(966)-N(2))-methyltransferase RsmD
MRIIQGKHKSKRISAPSNLPVRPTTDMAKEGLFNVIDNEFYFENLVVLDLFSGTGNISYEFCSRGTKSVTSVDNSFHCIKFIKSTAKELEFDQLQAYKTDVEKFISTSQSSFRLIFADPPYNMAGQTELFETIMAGNLLEDRGWLIIEHDAHHSFENITGFKQQRRYGSVNFTILEKN